MIEFIVGCFVGGFITSVIMCLLALAGRGNEDDDKS